MKIYRAYCRKVCNIQSDPAALRLSANTFCMSIAQTTIILICFVYLVTLGGLYVEARMVSILIVPLMIFFIVGIMKAKKIQDLSAVGNTEEMKRLYRQGIMYIWVFFMIFSIMTFAILYYLLR